MRAWTWLVDKLAESFIQCREAYANAPGCKNLIAIPIVVDVRFPEDNRGPSILVRPSEDYDLVPNETCVDLVVLWRWWRLVRLGLAVVQHHLILDLSEPGDSPLVLAVVSRRDGSLVLEESRLTPADGKAWGFASRHSGCGACITHTQELRASRCFRRHVLEFRGRQPDLRRLEA